MCSIYVVTFPKQERRIHGTEDRRVRANAQCKRDYRDRTEARIFGEKPKAVANIL
jgi:hypothetical protein